MSLLAVSCKQYTVSTVALTISSLIVVLSSSQPSGTPSPSVLVSHLNLPPHITPRQTDRRRTLMPLWSNTSGHTSISSKMTGLTGSPWLNSRATIRSMNQRKCPHSLRTTGTTHDWVSNLHSLAHQSCPDNKEKNSLTLPPLQTVISRSQNISVPI